ncbi:hypothetical protein KC317_g1245 [Hortaea werneckii]|nr:hypothetical protein KC323_g3191 [Hortaea werneckii]KAI7357780.1 hypothetical protein KC320_g1526 [Hortaea werneckii]KAI7571888.1 hypothetical protein KC317_g1245 [Hortaea werneckii]KAI7718161.1 hypothetical protein KC322_g2294 [Hortaea werneckii]RMZ18242.1 hypothetical protein D0862_00520 [Hortaea werneckii]
MPFLFRAGLAFSSLLAPVLTLPTNTSTGAESVNVSWLGRTPSYNSGTTFGLPWGEGRFYPNSTQFSLSDGAPLQSWVTSYWRDGSVKWTGHAIAESDNVHDQYVVTASAGSMNSSQSPGLQISDSGEAYAIDTGEMTVTFPKTGDALVSEIKSSAGKVLGQNGRLVLHSQSGIVEDPQDRANSSIDYFNFQSNIDNVTVSDKGPVRALVTVRGSHQVLDSGSHDDWLPFVVRFYLYANSKAIRIVHSLVYDGNANEDFISGVGLRFDVPLKGEELYNRHIRLAGLEGGLLNEAVKGLTGLRRDPGEEVRNAQFEGEQTPAVDTWDTRVSSRLQWIPSWNDYSLDQLSPDGFTLKKRTEPGQSWVTIPGSTRSGGLAYLGGATVGGLAVGLRDFWKRYPTGLDVRNAASDMGELTVWIYNPAAEPLDLRPYHDEMGLDTYEEQLDALEITYEDWEPGFATPFGIARTSELFVYAFDQTPTQERLSELTEHTNYPPVLHAEPEYIHETQALGNYWDLPSSAGGLAAKIESNMAFLNEFYQGQIEDRRWYGFLDYGDFMHTYDEDRHQWRYDIGGYAWDNSELSPDIFFWNYFLRTGREDVYRFAEALTRHTGEVDVYHIGDWKGLGTRHGVQHFGDSAKQARISTAQYRKVFYFISGGDERVGELLDETLDTDQTYSYLDPNRKVREDDWTPSPGSPSTIGLGTDWSALAASWLVEWERRGSRWQEAREKLTNTLTGIAELKNGFVTGSALYHDDDGTLDPPPTDPNNTGVVAVSHLSAVFGLAEVVAEIIQYYGDALPEGFEQAWLDYCYYYRAPTAEQESRYGESWGSSATLRQYHSRLLAYAAHRTGNQTLAQRAWSEFNADGLTTEEDWHVVRINGSEVLAPVDEGYVGEALISTNEAAMYGVAGIENLAFIADSLPEELER